MEGRPFSGSFHPESSTADSFARVIREEQPRVEARARRAARFKSGLESRRIRGVASCICTCAEVAHKITQKIKTSGGKQRIRERPEILSGDIEALISVISLSSNSSVPYTNYSCQQLNVFIPFCLLYYSTFILLFSPHLFTRIKAYSDRIIPLHNKNKSQRLHTHHSHSKSTAKL